jgi:hypothetical protein
MALFTVAEARAYDKKWLQDPTIYPDAVITAKEIAVRERFERIIGVALSATVSTEYYDGTDSDELVLLHHNPRAEASARPVTVASMSTVDAAGTETAFTADELAAVIKYPGRLVLRYGEFEEGRQNVKVVYTHGYVAAPEDLKMAALQVLMLPPPDGLVPSAAPSAAYEGTEGQIKWSRVKDSSRERWYGNEIIDSVLREHRGMEGRALIA